VRERQHNGTFNERTSDTMEMSAVELLCERLMLTRRRGAPGEQVMSLERAPVIRIDDRVRDQTA